MKTLLPICAALTTAKLSSVVMQGLVVRDSNHRWVPAPKHGLRVFTPSASFLSSSAMPFGVPPSLEGRSMPFSAQEQEMVDEYQRNEHQRLQEEVGFDVTGYVTYTDSTAASVVIQELPDVVGTKIWAGEWMLWGSLSRDLQRQSLDIKTVIELGAGCGLAGLLLAARGYDVIISDTSDGYGGAEKTYNNMVHNAEANEEEIKKAGGGIRPLDLDWTASASVPRVDLAIGADIIYEPHLFRALMDTIKRSSNRAILIQNVARAGTEQFRALCKAECSSFTATPVTMEEFGPVFPNSDGSMGRYEVWELRFEDASQQCAGAGS